MGNNNTHNSESREHRLDRLKSHPIEAIETLLNSIANFFNNEIVLTPTYHQTSLMILGIHASALTIGEVFFQHKSDLENYTDFIYTFIDGDTEDTKFSIVAEDIHNWRNIIAHQWIGSLGHRIEYDYQTKLGWQKMSNGNLIINPKIYCDIYMEAFSAKGKIWQYLSIFNEEQIKKAHQIIIKKYERR